jgi:hypothetical protein
VSFSSVNRRRQEKLQTAISDGSSMAQAPPLWTCPGFSRFIVSSALGIFAAFPTRAADRGLIGAKFLGVSVLLLMILWALNALRTGITKGWWVRRALISIIWLPITLPLFAMSWFVLGWSIAPDPGPLYFQLRSSYVETHWQIDPKTKRRYFAIDYFKIHRGPDSGKIFPRNFFLLEDGTFFFNPIAGEIKASCGNAEYSAQRVSEHVLIVRSFSDNPYEIEPCLIAATSTPGS